MGERCLVVYLVELTYDQFREPQQLLRSIHYPR